MGRPAWVWTDERLSAVQQDVQPTMSYAKLAIVAEAHGVSFAALYAAIRRGQIVHGPIYAKRDASNSPEKIERNCLCCGKKFMAETKFIRSCEPCRTHGSPLGDWGLGVV